MPPVKAGWNDIWRRIAISRRINLSMRKIRPQVEPGYLSTVLESADESVQRDPFEPRLPACFRRVCHTPRPSLHRGYLTPDARPYSTANGGLAKYVIIRSTRARFGPYSFPSIPRYYGRNHRQDCAIKCIQTRGRQSTCPDVLGGTGSRLLQIAVFRQDCRGTGMTLAASNAAADLSRLIAPVRRIDCRATTRG